MSLLYISKYYNLVIIDEISLIFIKKLKHTNINNTIMIIVVNFWMKIYKNICIFKQVFVNSGEHCSPLV